MTKIGEFCTDMVDSHRPGNISPTILDCVQPYTEMGHKMACGTLLELWHHHNMIKAMYVTRYKSTYVTTDTVGCVILYSNL